MARNNTNKGDNKNENPSPVPYPPFTKNFHLQCLLVILIIAHPESKTPDQEHAVYAGQGWNSESLSEWPMII